MQASGTSVQPTDAYVNYRGSDAVNVQIGQFNTPFTAENRTANDRLTYLDRAVPSRTLGTPSERDIGAMVWGHLEHRVLAWSWAVMQGDGTNRFNADNRFMTAARVFSRPLAGGGGPVELLQIGASFKYGSHDTNYVSDYPSMATQAGYRFWTPEYVDSVDGGRTVHVIPAGAQLGVAGELRIPFDRFDLRSELVYLKNNTREAVDGFQHGTAERHGAIKGLAYHITASAWLFGKPFLAGIVGDQGTSRLQLDRDDASVASHGLEVAIKWEHLNAKYEGASRSGVADARNLDGSIRFYALSTGVNYWASRHLRASVNYVLNVFPDASASGSPEQRAKAPGNRIDAGVDDSVRESASTLHEVSMRLAVAF